jgi:hypothetical protein
MKNNTRKVWVNPVERISPQGRDRQTYQIIDKSGNIKNTTNLKKTREPDTGVVYSFPFNTKSGKLYTGLSELVINPYHEMSEIDISQMFEIHRDYIDLLPKFLKKERVTRQELLELKHGKAPNDYHNGSGFTMFSAPTDMKNFDQGKGELAKLRLILYPRPNALKTDTIGSELKIAMVDALVKAGKIAGSRDLANPSIHEFYVSQDNEEETNLSKKRDLIEAAVYKLVKLKNESPKFKSYQFATVLRTKQSQTLVKGESTPERVKSVLSDYLSDTNSDQMEHVDRFSKLWDLSVTPEGADKVMVYYTLQQAINTGVILYREKQYLWPNKSSTRDMYELGNSFEKISLFFLKEMNTSVPKGKKVVTNFYQDLLDEVKAKNIKFE